ALEGDQVTARIGHCYVHLPIALSRLCHRGMNHLLGSVERYRGAIRHIERNCIRNGVKRVWHSWLCSGDGCCIFIRHWFLPFKPSSLRHDTAMQAEETIRR